MITPRHLHTREIYNFVQDLVLQGANYYNDLTLQQKQKISALIIKELGADDFESLTGCDNTKETMQIFADALFNNDHALDMILLQTLKMNALANHGWQINELMQEIKQSHHISRRLENGFIPYTDKQTGELCWRKSA
jgi:hypothetical protein